MSASNFLVTGQYTPDFFFPLNTDHHGATTFIFLLGAQRGIFMNKVTFPKANKPGLMSREWNSFGRSSGDDMSKKRKSVARGEATWLCWSSSVLWPFPNPHPDAHVLLRSP